MREPIIDPTRTLVPCYNPFGTGANTVGWYIKEICPVNGTSILDFPARETRDEVLADIDTITK